MPVVVIESSEWTPAGWNVRASVSDGANTWSAPHVLDMPETAAPAEIEAAIAALYQS